MPSVGVLHQLTAGEESILLRGKCSVYCSSSFSASVKNGARQQWKMDDCKDGYPNITHGHLKLANLEIKFPFKIITVLDPKQ